MALEGGVLARIDLRLLKELSDEPCTQLVKLPVSPAVWSTWVLRLQRSYVVSSDRSLIQIWLRMRAFSRSVPKRSMNGNPGLRIENAACRNGRHG